MGDWIEYSLEDHIDVKHGYAFKGKNIVKEETPNILVTPGNFNIGGGFKTNKFKFFNAEYPDDYVLKEGQIIVTMTDLSKQGDTLGYAAKVPEIKDKVLLHNQRIGLIQFQSNSIDPNFLYWTMRTRPYQWFILGSSTGTSVRHTSPTRIKEYIFLAPKSITEQNAIAELLSSLDDKIDLLHRQNKTLEALAETLFRHTFIDNVQEDWEEKPLAEVLTVKGGTTPSTKIEEFWGGNILWTTPRDLSNNQQMYLFDTARKITEQGLAKISSGLLPAGTLLLSSRAPVGYLAFSVNPIAINQGYIAIIDDKGFSKNYIYLWLKLHMDYVKSHANGSTFQEISKTSFKKLKIICSPQSFRDKFEEHIAPLFNKIEANSYQIISLENIRDTLLPKLMSGDIRVEYDETSQTEAA